MKPLCAVVSMLLLAPAALRAQEPPQPEGLACRVLSLDLSDGLRLAIAFSNATPAAISLPPAPHLVLYRDAAATDPMAFTARVDRVQRTPLVVPGGGEKTALLGADAQRSGELRCNPQPAAAAALYYYQFSRRPVFRCVLRDYPAGQPAIGPACAPGALTAPPTAPR